MPNTATIRFDSNAPIDTPTWSNVVDRLSPNASVAADGTANPLEARVTWSASDDASGIALYEIRVSKDGAASTLWRTATTAGSDIFTADSPGTYSFRVVAHDGAENTGQSTQASIALTAVAVPGTPSGVGASAGNAQATVTWTAPSATGGSQVTGYDITRYIGGVAQGTTSVGAVTQTTITGLTNRGHLHVQSRCEERHRH